MKIFVRKRNELYRVYIGSELQSKHINKESAMASVKRWEAVAKSTGETWDLVDKVEMIQNGMLVDMSDFNEVQRKWLVAKNS